MLAVIAHVHVHQREGECVETAARAHQPSVYLELRPVQGLLVSAHGVQRAPKRLDFFETAFGRIKAVGTPAHAQALMQARQADFGFVICAALLRHHQMPFATLLCRG